MLHLTRLSVVLSCAALSAACHDRVTSPVSIPGPSLNQSASAAATRRGMNPVARLIARRDALGLTADQVSRLETISNTLTAKNAPLREQMRAALGDRARPRGAGRAATQEERQARRAAWRAAREKVAPVRREMMSNMRAAMTEARAVLTPAQQATLRAEREARGRRGRAGRRA